MLWERHAQVPADHHRRCRAADVVADPAGDEQPRCRIGRSGADPGRGLRRDGRRRRLHHRRARGLCLRAGRGVDRVRRLSLDPVVARTAARGPASYFGVYTIRGNQEVRQLQHGTTVHGTQLLGSLDRERKPTAYYVTGSGVGQAMQAVPALFGDHARIGVVGLGAGTLACYAKPGQSWRFYEIDPAVVHIARDTGQFTFLKNCLPNPKIEVGDARLNLATEATRLARPADARRLLVRRGADAPDDARGVRHLGRRCCRMTACCSSTSPTSSSIWNPWCRPRRRPAGGVQQSCSISRGRRGAASRRILLGRAVARSGDDRGAEGARRDMAPAEQLSGIYAWTDDYSTIVPLVKLFRKP